MEAVRCDDAATAAAEGSRLELSGTDLPSGIDCGICVGELVFGVGFSHRPFLESLRPKLLVFSGGGCRVTGELMPSWVEKSGLPAEGWYGNGCERSLAIRNTGRSSALSFRYSSVIFRSSVSA